MIQDPLSFFQRNETSKTALVWAQSQKTTEASVKWISELPSGFDKDIARREVANRFIVHNPKRSFFQSNWIGNDLIREETPDR